MAKRGTVDAVVCAKDEAHTIRRVVRALRRSPRICCVIVVDDGSTDRTALRARLAGAKVISGPRNGKTAAMLAGLGEVHTRRVLFADADIRGLRPGHVSELTRGPGMVCGLRDNGSHWLGPIPPITGERCLPTLAAFDALAGAEGYGAELAIDAEVGRLMLPTRTFVMSGVDNPRRAPLRRTLQVLRAVPGNALGLLQYMAAWVITWLGAMLWG